MGNSCLESLAAAISQLKPLVENEVISIEDYRVFQQSAEQSKTLMLGLNPDSETWGLIHAVLT
jgi:hypothetical protein